MMQTPMRTIRLPRPAARATVALALAVLSGCAVIPDGPSTMALPGTGRSFAQFRTDDDACRRFASERVGGQSAQRAAQDTVAGGAIAGAAIGAVAGAALGGSQGAGVGAGTGLLMGSVIGSGAAGGSAMDVQRRYDHAYVQCMYASGHKVPVIEGYRSAAPWPAARPAPLPPGVPPPPAGPAPAPPPAAVPSSPLPPPAAVPSSPAPAATGASSIPPPPPGAPPPPPRGWRSG
jgi:hypothetical protein